MRKAAVQLPIAFSVRNESTLFLIKELMARLNPKFLVADGLQLGLCWQVGGTWETKDGLR